MIVTKCNNTNKNNKPNHTTTTHRPDMMAVESMPSTPAHSPWVCTFCRWESWCPIEKNTKQKCCTIIFFSLLALVIVSFCLCASLLRTVWLLPKYIDSESAASCVCSQDQMVWCSLHSINGPSLNLQKHIDIWWFATLLSLIPRGLKGVLRVHCNLRNGNMLCRCLPHWSPHCHSYTQWMECHCYYYYCYYYYHQHWCHRINHPHTTPKRSAAMLRCVYVLQIRYLWCNMFFSLQCFESLRFVDWLL